MDEDLSFRPDAPVTRAEAAALGLGSCMLGWLNDEKLRGVCGLDQPVRLVITLGYPQQGDPLRPKKRKNLEELVSEAENNS